VTVAEAAKPYLRLAGVRKDFGSFTALKGVDLDIAQGEFVCFLGPSGCGKTTLLRIIAGLEVQSAGRIELAGRDISTCRRPNATTASCSRAMRSFPT
jgi:iron(III) transport system ATP-binding protein